MFLTCFLASFMHLDRFWLVTQSFLVGKERLRDESKERRSRNMQIYSICLQSWSKIYIRYHSSLQAIFAGACFRNDYWLQLLFFISLFCINE